jgi:hypothetical protein
MAGLGFLDLTRPRVIGLCNSASYRYVYSAALLSDTVLVFCIRAPMHLHATSKLPGEDETNDAVSPHHLLGL